MHKSIKITTLALLISVEMTAIAHVQAEPLAADTSTKLGSGATFTAPKGWRLETKGNAQIMIAPEGDAVLAIVDVQNASNAADAVVAAWKTVQPSFDRTPKLETPYPGRDGWETQAVFAYETSPNEKRFIQAAANRKGGAWTVVVYDGAEATSEKRSSSIGLAITSLRPSGYLRESFAGKQARKLDVVRVAELKAFLSDGMEKLGVPGVAYALMQDGKIVDIGGIGVKKLGSQDLVDADTQFMIASNTKGLSTLMLATLVDEGKVAWDQPVTQVYTSFRLGNAATTASTNMRHLVCACTGLPRKDLEWIFNTPRDTKSEAVFAHLANTQPTSGFGEVFQYNNLITTAGGYIGGHLAYPNLPLGTAYDRAMQERVFGPLGMKDTHFSFARAIRSNVASPHGVTPDGKPALASLDLSYSIYPYRPAGGAWSTARDMARYAQLELTKGLLPDGKRLVSEANLLERRKHGISDGEDAWYGMGLGEDVSTGVAVVDHGGSMPGYKTNFWVVPDANVAAVLLTNADTGGVLTRQFKRRLLEVVYDGKLEAASEVESAAKAIRDREAKERERLTIPPDPQTVDGLATQYASSELGRIKVAKLGGGRVRFNFTDWSSEMATRKNDDGTSSLVTIDPSIDGFAFVIGLTNGRRSLIARDSQHEYVFTESTP